MNDLVASPATQTMSSIELVDFINENRKTEPGEVPLPVLRHDHFLDKVIVVLRKDAPKFRGIYLDSMNREKPCYHFPKREACLMAMSYSYDLQAKVFDRMTALENQQPAFNIPTTLSGALRLAAEQAEQIELLQIQAKADAPKVEFAMAVRNMEGSCLLGVFCKTLTPTIGRNNFFEWLRQRGVLDDSNLPYQKYRDSGYFVVIEQFPFTDKQGKTHPTFTTHITGKGQVWIEKAYRSEYVGAK